MSVRVLFCFIANLEVWFGDHFSRKSKIICTMRPACWDVEMLVQLIDAGMNVARLNFWQRTR